MRNCDGNGNGNGNGTQSNRVRLKESIRLVRAPQVDVARRFVHLARPGPSRLNPVGPPGERHPVPSPPT